jgi:hypothetical protein
MAQAAKMLGNMDLARIFGKEFSDFLNAAKSQAEATRQTQTPAAAPQENYYHSIMRERYEAAQRAQQTTPPPPPAEPPAATPPPPPPPAEPPAEEPSRYLGYDQFQKYMAARQQAEQPKLAGAIGELMSRLEDLSKAYKGGARPDDIATQGMKKLVREQEAYLTEKHARLSPEEQAAHAPLMNSMEQRRQQVEEEEIRRREKLNKGMSQTETTLYRFTQTLAHGDIKGAGLSLLSGAGPAGAITGAFAGFMLNMGRQLLDERLSEIRRGGRAVSPSGASTEDATRQLAEMREALREGEIARQYSSADVNFLREQARGHGLQDYDDPKNRWARFRELFWRRSPTLVPRGVEAHNRAQAAMAREGFVGPRAEKAFNDVLADYYRNFLREQGVEPKKTPHNIVVPGVSGGFTSNLGYQEELQVGTLQREDATNTVLRQILETLRTSGELLENIGDNTNGLDNLNPPYD